MSLSPRKQLVLSRVGIATLLVYCAVRIGFFLTSKLTPFEEIYAIVFLSSELFLLVQGLGLFLTIGKVAGNSLKEADARDAPIPPITGSFPSVAVIVAARHEPRGILENTFTTLMNLNYPNKTLYFLDDSTDDRYHREAEEISEKYSAKLFRRTERHGAKAGIINDLLKEVKEKYIAVFDADQNPMPDFLLKTVAILENGEKLAFVQTPQFYTNLESGPVARGAGMQQAIFYEIICEAKGHNNAMFCCGTNVVFRKEALDKVGGFDEDSITEDFSTSLELHSHGYQSYYYNHAEVFGMGPESLVAYFKQQIRWATGTIGILKKIPRTFIRGPGSLSFAQWWEYLLSSIYYLIGWAIFITMISPILNLLFHVSPFMGNSVLYLGTFLPFFFISIFLFFLTMKARKYTFKQVYQGVLLTYLSFPVFMISVFYGLFTKNRKFAITSKGKFERLPFAMLIPYIVMIALSVGAIARGIVDFRMTYNYAILMNMFWVLYNLFIFVNIFYFNTRAGEK